MGPYTYIQQMSSVGASPAGCEGAITKVSIDRQSANYLRTFMLHPHMYTPRPQQINHKVVCDGVVQENVGTFQAHQKRKEKYELLTEASRKKNSSSTMLEPEMIEPVVNYIQLNWFHHLLFWCRSFQCYFWLFLFFFFHFSFSLSNI